MFSKTTLEKDMSTQLASLLGSQGTSLVLHIIDHTKKPSNGIIGSIMSTVALVFGALGVFGQLQQMLNTIWGVTQKPIVGIKGFIQSRVLNFSVFGMIAFLLLVSLLASSVTVAVGTYFTHLLHASPFLIEVLNALISFLLIAVLFGIMFKVLPDVVIPWKHVWVGSFITALLFTIGKEVIGIYIGHSGVASEYGVAGSLIVLLLWVYYSTQIVFFGSELTKAIVIQSGHTIVPNKYGTLTQQDLKTDTKKASPPTPQIQEVIEGLSKGVQKGLRSSKKKK